MPWRKCPCLNRQHLPLLLGTLSSAPCGLRLSSHPPLCMLQAMVQKLVLTSALECRKWDKPPRNRDGEFCLQPNASETRQGRRGPWDLASSGRPLVLVLLCSVSQSRSLALSALCSLCLLTSRVDWGYLALKAPTLPPTKKITKQML